MQRTFRRRIVPVFLLSSLWAITQTAYADTLTYNLNPNFNIAAGTPITQTINVTGGLPVYGLSFSGNWSAVSGNPYSEDLRLDVSHVSLPATGPQPLGGQPNANPFTFAPQSFNTTANGGYSSLFLSPTGLITPSNFDLTFTTIADGTVANLKNSSVTFYTNAATQNGTVAANGTTYNRPTDAGNALSGNTVNYSLQKFTVSQTGRYLIAGLGGSASDDTFLTLYQNGFDASRPLNNLIGAGDDGVSGVNNPTFTANLSAGIDYYLINSLNNGSATDNGYTDFIAGAGMATFAALPEADGRLLFCAAALPAMICWRRRKQPN